MTGDWAIQGGHNSPLPPHPVHHLHLFLQIWQVPGQELGGLFTKRIKPRSSASKPRNDTWSISFRYWIKLHVNDHPLQLTCSCPRINKFYFIPFVHHEVHSEVITSSSSTHSKSIWLRLPDIPSVVHLDVHLEVQGEWGTAQVLTDLPDPQLTWTWAWQLSKVLISYMIMERVINIQHTSYNIYGSLYSSEVPFSISMRCPKSKVPFRIIVLNEHKLTFQRLVSIDCKVSNGIHIP